MAAYGACMRARVAASGVAILLGAHYLTSRCGRTRFASREPQTYALLWLLGWVLWWGSSRRRVSWLPARVVVCADEEPWYCDWFHFGVWNPAVWRHR